MSDEISEELANVLRHIRRSIDERSGDAVYFGLATRVRIDAILDRYEEACRPPAPIITRVEVITDTGRDYVSWEKDNNITTSLQDEGRTLKIFVSKCAANPKPKFDLKDFLNRGVMVRFHTGVTKTGVIHHNPNAGSFRFQ